MPYASRKTHSIPLIAVVTLLSLKTTLAFASDSNVSLSGKLVIAGSSTVAPLVAEIGKRFESINPKVRVDVQTGGSARGIADVRSGLADIGMASRDLFSEESELQAHKIAVDGVAVIVHQDNPVSSLNKQQVIDIYTAKTRNWQALGGSDKPIVVINKADGRATLEVFLEFFGIAVEDIRADLVIGDNQQGIKSVAGNSAAIAYVSIGAADYESQHGTPIKLIKLGDIEASLENVAAGRFPVTRPLVLVTKGEPSPLVKAFLAFSRSPDVNDLIRAQYFVSLNN